MFGITYDKGEISLNILKEDERPYLSHSAIFKGLKACAYLFYHATTFIEEYDTALAIRDSHANLYNEYFICIMAGISIPGFEDHVNQLKNNIGLRKYMLLIDENDITKSVFTDDDIIIKEVIYVSLYMILHLMIALKNDIDYVLRTYEIGDIMKHGYGEF